MVEANTNAKLLKITDQQLVEAKIALAAKDSALVAKDSTITATESIVSLKEEIITGKDLEIGNLRLAYKKQGRKLKWTRFKWAGTTIGLTGALLYIAFK